MVWYSCLDMLQPEIFSGALRIKVSINFSYQLQVYHRTFQHLTLKLTGSSERNSAKLMVCLRKHSSLISLPLSSVMFGISYITSSGQGTPYISLEKSYLPKFYPHTHKALSDLLTKRLTQRVKIAQFALSCKGFMVKNHIWSYLSNQIRNILLTQASTRTPCSQSNTANKQLICFSIW